MQQDINYDIDGARTATDNFARHQHAEPVALAIDELRGVLWQIDDELPDGTTLSNLIMSLEGAIAKFSDVVDTVVPELRERAHSLLVSVRGIQGSLAAKLPLSAEIPSKPLFGVLPLKRVVPQDVHSVLDYAGGLGCVAGAFLADSVEGKAASAGLAATVIGVSLMTDYRLSAVKVVPIEAHEVADYVFGIGCIALPFALGYYKKDPLVAAVHVVTGASTILASLFTDYRAAKGVGRKRIGG